MNLKRCPNGHYYDGEEYAFCPKCESQGLTAPAGSQGGQAAEKEDLTAGMQSGMPVARTSENAAAPQPAAPEKKGPVAGWLVCIEGDTYGRIYEMKYGENRIGDSADMDILLARVPKADGGCQVTVTYDQESKTFTANVGETRELSYVNDQVILFETELHGRDTIQTGGTRLMFIPLCGPDFSWEDKKGNL